jgi:acyl-CoA synthetase (NDP forming)
LTAALAPSSIAIIGASENPNKIGGRPLLFLGRFGYTGRIYPINPNRDEVQGLRAYPDIFAVPETPDLVVVATPGALAVGAVNDCAARGVRVAVIMASGFGETADPAAIAAERAMVDTARRAGMRLVGPNSQGLANFGTGAIASFSTMFLEVTPADGPVGVISQSGMMSTAPYGLLRRAGIGVRHAHATGNDADITLAEMALAVVQDPELRLLLLYIESIRDPENLARAAAIARERDVPIVAVKAGRSARGQAAARSHTGALSSEDRVVGAFLKQHGIWRVRDVHELVAAASLYLKGWRPSSGRLAVVSNSGASCVMAADTADDEQLELATLGDDTVSRLAGELPSFATATNPIDLTAALLTDSRLFGRILRVLADDPAVDLLLVALPVAGAGYDVPSFARAAREFAAHANKAIAVATPQENVAALFVEAGVPTFSNQTDAIEALAQLTRHSAMMRRRSPPGDLDDDGSQRVPVPDGSWPFLDEAQSLEFLRAHGLPTVPFRLCRTEGDVRAAYRDLGSAVVVKACAPALPHKSEHGMVILDCRNEASAAEAFAIIHERLRQLAVDGSVIVAPIIGSRREFMLGARVDPTFGPVLLVGDGGRYVEALDDVAVLLAPASPEDVRDALLALHVAPLFRGLRGEPALDVEALCAAAVRLGRIITTHQDQVASIDLNPVMVGPQGVGVQIVDALVERRTAAHGNPGAGAGAVAAAPVRPSRKAQ